MEIHQQLLQQDAKKLYAFAKKLMIAVEMGEFSEEQMV